MQRPTALPALSRGHVPRSIAFMIHDLLQAFLRVHELRPAHLQAIPLWFDGGVEKWRRVPRQSLQPIKTVIDLYHERAIWSWRLQAWI
jgi:hypothetical protein